MENNIKAAAQKELLRRKAKAELERRKSAKSQSPQVGIGEDMAKGAATGVAQGVIGMGGMFGDAAKLNSDLLRSGAEYLDAPEMVQDAAGWAGKALMGPLGMGPTSKQLTGAVEGVTGPMYEAQRVPGQFAQTAGQFAPSALLGGGAMLPKALTSLGAAVGSETAGQLTKGTPFETPARIGAGLLSAVGAHKASQGLLYKNNPVRTTAQIETAANKSYKAADKIGMALKPKTTNYFIDKLQKAAGDAGFFADNHPKLANAMKAIEQWRDVPITLDQIKALRTKLKSSYNPMEADQNRVMGRVLDEFDDYIANVPDSAIQSGNAKLATSLLSDARKEWSTFRKAEKIDDIFQNAKNAEGANYSQASVTTSIRQQLRALAKDDFKRAKYFNTAERQQILETIQGGKMENFLKAWGKYGIKSPLGVGASTATAGGLSLIPGIGPVLGGAVGATLLGGGTVARPIARQMGVNSVENLSKFIRNRGPVERTSRLLGSPAKRKSLPIGVGVGILGSNIPQLGNR
jgi:hypothetical protein